MSYMQICKIPKSNDDDAINDLVSRKARKI